MHYGRNKVPVGLLNPRVDQLGNVVEVTSHRLIYWHTVVDIRTETLSTMQVITLLFCYGTLVSQLNLLLLLLFCWSDTIYFEQAAIKPLGQDLSRWWVTVWMHTMGNQSLISFPLFRLSKICLGLGNHAKWCAKLWMDAPTSALEVFVAFGGVGCEDTICLLSWFYLIVKDIPMCPKPLS